MPFALVTGANRGLGLEVSRQLLRHGFEVCLTAREAQLAERAVDELALLGNVHSAPLDVTRAADIDALARALANGPRIDALVNNAGTTFSGFDADVARRTLDVNYRGAVRVTDALSALLAPTANIVMVSSGMGELSRFRTELAERLLDPKLDRGGLDVIARDFVDSVAGGRHSALGFPSNAYSVSKALLNGFTRVLARELGRGQRVNAVCPGWVRTRMGGAGAPRSVERGATGIVWAATLGEGGPSGTFFRDGQPINW